MQTKTTTQMPSEYGTESKQYKLIKSSPLELVIPTRHTHRSPLLHFDNEKKINRSLRYSSNQKSPFEDEQDEHVRLEPVIFQNGFLSVDKTNPVLQWFLDLHPLKGKLFMEVNKKQDAKQQIARFKLEDDADNSIREMDTSTRRDVAFMIFSKKSTAWSNEEILVELRKYARKEPKKLLQIVNDATVEEKSIIQKLLSAKILDIKFGSQVYMRTSEIDEKILDIPKKSKQEKTPDEYIMEFLTTAEGSKYMEILERELLNRQ